MDIRDLLSYPYMSTIFFYMMLKSNVFMLTGISELLILALGSCLTSYDFGFIFKKPKFVQLFPPPNLSYPIVYPPAYLLKVKVTVE